MSITENTLLPAGAVCKLLGISRATLYRWSIDPRLKFPPTVLIRTRCYWRETQLETWLQAQAKPTRRRERLHTEGDQK